MFLLASRARRVTIRAFGNGSSGWLETEKGAISEGTLVRYKRIVKDFLTCIGSAANLRLANITTEDVLKYREQLEADEDQEMAADEQTAVLLKRFSGNPDVEEARAEFGKTQEVEERFHQ
jgi:hypothetical protein